MFVELFVVQTYLSVSFAFPAAPPAVFFLFGTGILHSIENATQFVHGTPRLAASHLTYVPIDQLAQLIDNLAIILVVDDLGSVACASIVTSHLHHPDDRQ